MSGRGRGERKRVNGRGGKLSNKSRSARRKTWAVSAKSSTPEALKTTMGDVMPCCAPMIATFLLRSTCARSQTQKSQLSSQTRKSQLSSQTHITHKGRRHRHRQMQTLTGGTVPLMARVPFLTPVAVQGVETGCGWQISVRLIEP